MPYSFKQRVWLLEMIVPAQSEILPGAVEVVNHADICWSGGSRTLDGQHRQAMAPELRPFCASLLVAKVATASTEQLEACVALENQAKLRRGDEAGQIDA